MQLVLCCGLCPAQPGWSQPNSGFVRCRIPPLGLEGSRPQCAAVRSVQLCISGSRRAAPKLLLLQALLCCRRRCADTAAAAAAVVPPLLLLPPPPRRRYAADAAAVAAAVCAMLRRRARLKASRPSTNKQLVLYFVLCSCIHTIVAAQYIY